MANLLNTIKSVVKQKNPTIVFSRHPHVEIKSAAIKAVIYDKENQELVMYFKHGGVYKYQGLEADMFYRLLAQDSAGKFFVENIRNNYQFTKLEVSNDQNN